MNEGLQIIEKAIVDTIKDQLDIIGVLYRIFSRVKDKDSILEKIERNKKKSTPYSDKKLMQDIIGVRVVVYFKDDVELVKSILKTKLEYKDKEIDSSKLTVFEPKRTNIICTFPENYIETFKDIQKTSHDYMKIVDATFELQLRTILSEGWYEVDHNLRYKCKDDWKGHFEEERMLNGIYAGLETNDIVLKNLFNELAYKHFKNNNWNGMIRTKFRLRFQLNDLDERILNLLNENKNIAKEILKLDRLNVLEEIFKSKIIIPINLSNLIYLINILFLKNTKIDKFTPETIKGYL